MVKRASEASNPIWRTIVVAGAMLGTPIVAAGCGGGDKKETTLPDNGGRDQAIPKTPPTAKPAPPSPVPPQPNVPAVVGAIEIVKLSSQPRFIGDVVVDESRQRFIRDIVDGDAQGVAYLIDDRRPNRTELHLYTYATKKEHVIDFTPFSKQLAIDQFVLLGARVFVAGTNENGDAMGALVELADNGKAKAGSAVYKLGPAAAITVIKRDGKQRVALHKVSSVKTGTRHDVAILAIETGKLVAAAKPFELDPQNKHAKLEFVVNHWSEGFTRAHGTKAGGPDVEASYDLVTGKIYDEKKIDDVAEQRKRFQAIAGSGVPEGVVMARDNSRIELWTAEGRKHTVTLDQPLVSYDPKSLQGLIVADGSAWIALKIDPVNVEAVAHKKADVEYLDIFRVAADGKATRKARVLSHQLRHQFGVIGERFWLLERHTSLARDAHLTLYQLQ